jgi:hypothetical protein
VALAFAAVSFAIALDLRDITPKFEFFDLYGNFPRLLLVLGFGGMLLLSPLVQALARWGLAKLGLGIWEGPI